MSIKHISEGEIYIESQGVKTGDHWVAVMLPVNTQQVIRGKPIYMKADLVAEQPPKVEACLGIYNGKEDVCSERILLRDTQSLEVKSLISNDNPLNSSLIYSPMQKDIPLMFG